MEEIRAGRPLDTEIAHLIFETPIDELNRMDEVSRYSRDSRLAYAALERLKTRVRLAYDCRAERHANGGVVYSCLVSTGDAAGKFEKEFWGYGHTEALAICRAVLEVVRANPIELRLA